MEFSLIPLLFCENNSLLFIGREQIILHLSLPLMEYDAEGKQTMPCPFPKTNYLPAFVLKLWVLETADYQAVHLQFLVRRHLSPFPFTPKINKVDGCF